jgi:hypothetical protein
MAMNITNVEGVYLLPRLWIYPICMSGINLIYPTFFLKNYILTWCTYLGVCKSKNLYSPISMNICMTYIYIYIYIYIYSKFNISWYVNNKLRIIMT